MAERSNAPDCKSGVSDYVGSNPTPSTTLRLQIAKAIWELRVASHTEAIGEVVPLVALLAERSGAGYNPYMYFVYLIQSEINSKQKYIGLTDNVQSRLKDHNDGKSIHTNKFKPWRLVTYFAFSSKQAAVDFERYLKTGSGWAFAKKKVMEMNNKTLKADFYNPVPSNILKSKSFIPFI